jgi:hypothetical protein
MERQGQYGGVGCRITQRNHYPTVEHIEEGYAFDIADVRLGDQITHINGLNLKDNFFHWIKRGATEKYLVAIQDAETDKLLLGAAAGVEFHRQGHELEEADDRQRDGADQEQFAADGGADHRQW